MGCSISCKRLPSAESPTPKNKNNNNNNNVRIIHLNGHVTQLDYPATVAEVTGIDSHFFLFTQAQLLSNISKPLTPETVLEAGKLYFSLPYSLFESGVSPMDMAPIAKRLASKAQKDHRKSKRKHGKGSSVWSSHVGNTNPTTGGVFSNSSDDDERENDHCSSVVGIIMDKSSKSRSWKPSLDTIREKSFNRRSESDLMQELSHV